MAANEEHLAAAETIDAEGDDVAGSVPPAAETIDRESPVAAPVRHINTQPVNHHLFATLKAIVDPHHQQGTGADKLASLPLSVVNPDADRIKQFILPPEYLNEEQYR